MRHTDDGGFRHTSVTHRRVLDVDRTNPFASGLDNVLGPVRDRHVAHFVDRGDVAGIKPTVARMRFAGAFQLEVVAAYPGPPDLQCAISDAIPGQLVAIVVDDAHLNTVDASSGFGLERERRICIEMLGAGLHRADRAQRTHLSHAPALDDVDVVFVVKLADHRLGHRGTADNRPFELVELLSGSLRILEQPQPDGRHTQ